MDNAGFEPATPAMPMPRTFYHGRGPIRTDDLSDVNRML